MRSLSLRSTRRSHHFFPFLLCPSLCSAYARLILLSRLRSLHRDARIWRSEYALLCVQ